MNRKLHVLGILMVLMFGFMLVSATQVEASTPPTVDGLFYGSGEDSVYLFLAESPGRGTLYYYLDGATLYIAAVVDRAVNDNVFGDSSGPDCDYIDSAGWVCGGSHHTFKALDKSDHLEFGLTCDGGAIDTSWIHGLVYWNGTAWDSGAGDDSMAGTLPTGISLIAQASSTAYNMNAAGYNNSINQDTIKSPDTGIIGDVTDEPGYPAVGDITFGDYGSYLWEWSVVYEMSLDVSACNNTQIDVEALSAHNSPPKSGDPDIPILPPYYDRGDLPDTYTTTDANGGALHEIRIGDSILGATRDGELDGTPTADATGDGDDEDGVSFETSSWSLGNGSVIYEVTGDACLNVWVDFGDGTFSIVRDNTAAPDGDGDFDADEHVIVNSPVTAGLGFGFFSLPAGMKNGDSYYLRARLTPRDADNGCAAAEAYGGARVGADPNGLAIGGEVEDYLVLISGGPTAITLAGVDSGNSSWAIIVVLFVGLALTGLTGLSLKRRHN